MQQTNIITVVPTLDTSAYANGDLLFDATAVALPWNGLDGSVWLADVQAFDADDQTLYVWDLYIASTSVDMGTLNSAPSTSDADAVNLIGRIRFDGTASPPDGVDVGGGKLYSKAAGNPPLPIAVRPAIANPNTLYVCGVCVTGTPTHTATGLKLRLTFIKK